MTAPHPTHILAPDSFTWLWQGFAEMRPFGKARPRLKGRRAYMPQAYVRKKDDLANLLGRNWPKGTGRAIALEVVAFRKIPQRPPAGAVPFAPVKSTPDIDNILGAVFDAMYKDDAHIFAVFGAKVWSPTGDDGILVNVYTQNLDIIKILW